MSASRSGSEIVRHLRTSPGRGLRPLFKGLPGDACQCPRWGYIGPGSIQLRPADGTAEINRAGDFSYWPGGHTGWTDEGVTSIEVSPAAELPAA